jgi:polypeptide N-acetylgalactosaminyltransferase
MTKNFGQPYGLATVTECILELYSPQLFILTPEGYIKTDDSVCLDAPEFKDDESEVRIMACNTLQRQQWARQQDSIVHKLSGKCLDLPTQTTRGGLSLRSCDSYSQSQRWDLEPIHWRNHTKSIETGEKL